MWVSLIPDKPHSTPYINIFNGEATQTPGISLTLKNSESHMSPSDNKLLFKMRERARQRSWGWLRCCRTDP